MPTGQKESIEADPAFEPTKKRARRKVGLAHGMDAAQPGS